MANEDGWGGWSNYMRSKRKKLLEQFEEAEIGEKAQSQIFKGITIHVNGYTDPPADKLKQLMKSHGGMYSIYPGNDVTHTVVSQLAQSKIKNVGKNDKFVNVKWITDSIGAGRLLPDEGYIMYKKDETSGPKSINQFLQKKSEPLTSSTVDLDSAVPTTSRDRSSTNGVIAF